jgi:DNA-binding MarR family transcriptional regulator
METFLKVSKKYFNNNLKPLEILILSQIEEFINNGRECYLTNKQFAQMFSVTEPTVDKALDRLEQLNYIRRMTNFISNRGQASKMRQLMLVNPGKRDYEWSF